jgi:hypothetical protein
VEGVVVRGQRRGRALGFPTANLETPPYTAIPADGIYAGWLLSLTADGEEEERWPAAISVGPNVTFNETERTVEAYALDRDDLDLYGAHVAIDFSARLRGTVRFDSIDDLVTQMRRDVAEARTLRAQVAQRGKARHQCSLGMLRRQNCPVLRRLGQHLLVPQLFVVGVQKDVRVQIHQAGQYCHAGQRDALRVRRHCDAGLRADRLDLIAFDENNPAGVQRLARRPHLRRL